jgi:hypothetical protein
MAITQNTIGAGRVGLKKLFAIETEKVEPQYKYVVGRTDTTTQTSEVYKQYAGLGPTTQTPEGDDAVFDDLAPLFVAAFKPVLYTKGIRMSKQTSFTDQYGKLKNLTPAMARSAMERKNLNVADLDNSGFTNTTNGMNSEPLYSGSHQMGTGLYGSNRPLAIGQVPGPSPTTVDLTLGPTTLQWAWKDLRRQQSARGLPMPPTGKLDIKVPPELYLIACSLLRSVKIPGTPNNDDFSPTTSKFNDPMNIDYYTSTTAWYLKSSNVAEHGLFFLSQMPWDVEMLPMTRNLMNEWIGFESWIYGWYDWHGTWATLGQ